MKKLLLFSLILFVAVIMTGCFTPKEMKYFADETNYVVGSGIVEQISYYQDSNNLYISIREEDASKCGFAVSTFRIIGENVDAMWPENIMEHIHIGDEIVFITAPRVIGDGWSPPIVALEINGEQYLEYAVGFANWQAWLSEQTVVPIFALSLVQGS